MSPSPEKGFPRWLNVTLASLALVLLSPVLLVCMAAVAVSGRGGVFYRQVRAGVGGSEFVLWKLRTMVPGSDPVGVGEAVTASDARVTAVGRILRRFSLDELPNLFNVVSGDMAVVGPRPTLPAQVDHYTPDQLRRLEVPPGITGWAQIHGRAGIPWEERIQLDTWYVDHRSRKLDLEICLRSVPVLLGLGPSRHQAEDVFAGSDPDSPLRKAAEQERAERRSESPEG